MSEEPTVTVGGLRFALRPSDDGVALIGFGKDPHPPILTIPARVRVNSWDVPVVEIAKLAFQHQEWIEKVIIPSTVRRIVGSAFEDHKHLTSLFFFFPNSDLTVIGAGGICRGCRPHEHHTSETPL
jgi:hypothetical protein